MGLDTIIALDLGKLKSVACVMDAGTRRHAFATLDTRPQRLHDLFAAHATAHATAHTGHADADADADAADPARTLVANPPR